MQKYETTIIIDSLLKNEDIESTIEKTQTFMKNNGGNIIEVENWGKKRLAYEINRKQYGNYYRIHFEAPSSLPQLLERELRLQEAVLRFLTIKSHPKATLKVSEEEESPKESDDKEASPKADSKGEKDDKDKSEKTDETEKSAEAEKKETTETEKKEATEA